MSNYTTPIVDYLNEYAASDMTRLHMPGHKGVEVSKYKDEFAFVANRKEPAPTCIEASEVVGGLVAEKTIEKLLAEIGRFDITEITGADNLYDSSGIIKESEENASKVFGAKTFYSTEGSSQANKAMLYLAKKHWENSKGSANSDAAQSFVASEPDGAKNSTNEIPCIIAVGSCHKSFYHAAELLNIRVIKVENNVPTPGGMACLDTTDKLVSEILNAVESNFNPIGVFITYPDYFGNVTDLKEIKNALSKLNIPLLVDGAHSAYFKFLDYDKYPEYKHPTDCGADLCCTSAHKTLPALTGTAYLHVNESFSDVISEVSHAMDLFGSTSPSYLLMASLDLFNGLSESYKKEVRSFCKKIELLKKELTDMGFTIHPSDPLRIVVCSDERFKGSDFASSLREHKCEVECYDEDYIIMMLTPYNTDKDLDRIYESFLSLADNSQSTNTPSSSEFNCLVNFK